METSKTEDSNNHLKKDAAGGGSGGGESSHRDSEGHSTHRGDEKKRPLIAIIYDQAESLMSSDLDENDKKVLTENLEHLKELENNQEQSLVEASNLNKLQFLKINNDITAGLDNFEFEFGLENEDLDYYFLRMRTHCFYTTACAHAAYFVGIANSIRRNLDDIKKSTNELIMAKKTKLLIDGKKRVGLRIGIIGCGALGRQLATALLAYGDVMPNELQISTRQPEKIDFLKARGVKCYYDNAKVASSVNVLFLCVLPHQLDMVINDIRPALPDKCFIYSFVRATTAVNLKSYFKDLFCSEFVIKPEYSINKSFNAQLFKKWNYNGDIVESLDSAEIVSLSNPFSERDQMIIQNNEHFTATFIYAIMNICAFLTLNRKETMNSLRSFLFEVNSKPVKIEESHFSDSNSSSLFFPIVNLVDASLKPTPLFNRIQKSKSFRASLFRNYNIYFQETFRWKNSSTP